jgi:hypothetical protein
VTPIKRGNRSLCLREEDNRILKDGDFLEEDAVPTKEGCVKDYRNM